MRIAILVAAGAAALSLAACNSPEDNAAEATADNLEAQADAVEANAGSTPAAQEAADAQANALEQKADQVEQNAGNADGGATTGNTPTTTPPAN